VIYNPENSYSTGTSNPEAIASLNVYPSKLNFTCLIIKLIFWFCKSQQNNHLMDRNLEVGFELAMLEKQVWIPTPGWLQSICNNISSFFEQPTCFLNTCCSSFWLSLSRKQVWSWKFYLYTILHVSNFQNILSQEFQKWCPTNKLKFLSLE